MDLYSVENDDVKAFWQGKRVAVTGGSGMVGSQLVPLLLALGANVVVLDDASRGHHFEQGAKYHRVDAGEYEACRYLFGGAFAVFNLAAYVAGVLHNQSHHTEMFERNVRLQTVPVLAAADCKVDHFVQVSSVCVYPTNLQAPCEEESGHVGEPHEANAGYAWAKRMGERAVAWSSLQHAVIVRPQNITGERDRFGPEAHVIPALIEKFAIAAEQGLDTVEVHGTGKEVREFIYSGDVAKGMLAAAQFGDHQEAYTLGTDGVTAVTISALVERIQTLTKTEHVRVKYTGGNAGDLERYSDATKAYRDLGWYAELPLSATLERVVSWYYEHSHVWQTVRPIAGVLHE